MLSELLYRYWLRGGGTHLRDTGSMHRHMIPNLYHRNDYWRAARHSDQLSERSVEDGGVCDGSRRCASPRFRAARQSEAKNDADYHQASGH